MIALAAETRQFIGVAIVLCLGAWWMVFRYGEPVAFVSLGISFGLIVAVALNSPDWYSRVTTFFTGLKMQPLLGVVLSVVLVNIIVLSRFCPVRGKMPKGYATAKAKK